MGLKPRPSRMAFCGQKYKPLSYCNGVKDAIGQVFLNSQQISLNVNQQAFAIQQVLEAMTSINLGARETTAGIARVKDSIILLNQTAKELKKLS